ncbi:asparagine synthase (glutamine-hydrolyzing) [Caldicellulosiruptoraceae bacterium PP1]
MCGIAGIVSFDNNLLNQTDNIKSMTSVLTHRGPDQFGFYFSNQILLGHRRLIVIDPVGGKQPMKKVFNGKTYIIVYNGELYNTNELRHELLLLGHSFNSYSDTEVLLSSYIQWKEKCLEKINGIFSFAIWCEEDKTLFLARDHLGVKPLFYSYINNTFIFASEIKALLKSSFVSTKVDQKGVCELIGLGPARSPFSAIFKDINELPPAHYILYSNKKLTVKEYWSLPIYENKYPINELIEHIRILVSDAIKRQTVSDVGIVTFLSGGLDSSIISLITSKYINNLKTFSIDYKDNNLYFKENLLQPTMDTQYALTVSNSINSYHKIIEIEQDTLVHSLEEALYANDLPGMADIDSSLYLFCKEIKKEATVALSGECADEIFGGYPWYWRDDYKTAKLFPWARSLMFRKNLLSSYFDKELLHEYVEEKYKESITKAPIIHSESDEQKLHRRLFYLNIKWFMVTLLNRKDRMSMANSLEVRVPFADYRIVELLFNIPWKIKYYNNIEKGLLRKAFEGLLPNEIIYRRKSPYPKTYNPQYFRLIKNILIDIYNNPHPYFFNIINKDYLKSLLDNQNDTLNIPFFGQLMTLPQLFGYLIQINYWLTKYNIQLY